MKFCYVAKIQFLSYAEKFSVRSYAVRKMITPLIPIYAYTT